MYANDSKRQIVFWRPIGRRLGLQDTLSFKRFRLSAREWASVKRNVERILEAQRAEAPHLQGTTDWLESIPRKLYAYLQDRLLAEDPQFVVSVAVDLAELLDEFESFRQQQPTNEGTDAALIRDCTKLLRCGNDIRRIDAGRLNDLAAELFDECGYAPNTLARHRKHWTTFFNWVRDRGSISSNPCESLEFTFARQEKDEVRTEWVDQMVRSCRRVEEKYWLRLVQWTGCRLREGLSLRVCDIDWPKNRISFHETKNDRLRINPIYPAVGEYLAELLRGTEPTDNRLVLQSITPNNCYSWLYELRDRVGVPAWQPPYNAFRATRANQLAADKSISPQQAGLLLGHSAAVARRNYLSVDESLLERLAS